LLCVYILLCDQLCVGKYTIVASQLDGNKCVNTLVESIYSNQTHGGMSCTDNQSKSRLNLDLSFVVKLKFAQTQTTFSHNFLVVR